MSSSNNPVWGQQDQFTQLSNYNALLFMIQQVLSKRHTMTLVRVMACTNDGSVSSVGTVDVQPMVNQLDGAGNAVPHGTLFKLPYQRIQGGTNAIIMDPAPGDIGIAVFAERDISTVKKTRDIANPASARQGDMADGVYLGGILNGQPAQYLQFTPIGINVISPVAVTITAESVKIGADGDTLHKLVTDAFEAIYNAHTHPLDIPHGVTLAPSVPMTTSELTSTLEAG